MQRCIYSASFACIYLRFLRLKTSVEIPQTLVRSSHLLARTAEELSEII